MAIWLKMAIMAMMAIFAILAMLANWLIGYNFKKYGCE